MKKIVIASSLNHRRTREETQTSGIGWRVLHVKKERREITVVAGGRRERVRVIGETRCQVITANNNRACYVSAVHTCRECHPLARRSLSCLFPLCLSVASPPYPAFPRDTTNCIPRRS